MPVKPKRAPLALNTLLLVVQTAAYNFSGSTFLVCTVLILTKSVTTMLFIMVTLKVVLNNLAGQVAESSSLQGLFTIFMWVSVGLLAFSFLIRIPKDEKKYFAGEV